MNYRTLRCACYRGLIGGLGAMRRMSAMRREDAHDVSYRTLIAFAVERSLRSLEDARRASRRIDYEDCED